MLAVIAGILIAAWYVGRSGDGDAFRADQAWLYAAIVAAAYLVSRGLAKSGSREPYWDGDADQREEREPSAERKRSRAGASWRFPRQSPPARSIPRLRFRRTSNGHNRLIDAPLPASKRTGPDAQQRGARLKRLSLPGVSRCQAVLLALVRADHASA